MASCFQSLWCQDYGKWRRTPVHSHRVSDRQPQGGYHPARTRKIRIHKNNFTVKQEQSLGTIGTLSRGKEHNVADEEQLILEYLIHEEDQEGCILHGGFSRLTRIF